MCNLSICLASAEKFRSFSRCFVFVLNKPRRISLSPLYVSFLTEKEQQQEPKEFCMTHMVRQLCQSEKCMKNNTGASVGGDFDFYRG